MVKCQSGISEYCTKKAEKGLMANRKKVCKYCFNKIKENNKKTK